MKPFIESIHCTSRIHCRACRANAEWRKRLNAPDVGPFGVSAADTIAPAADAEKNAIPKKAIKRSCCGK